MTRRLSSSKYRTKYQIYLHSPPFRSFGLSISDYPVGAGSGSVAHYFRPENVKLGDGSLDLVVNAYDGGDYVYSAEIASDQTTLYGSLRTVLKSSGVPGVCEGLFFYSEFDATRIRVAVTKCSCRG